jgi:hypothetical protein
MKNAILVAQQISMLLIVVGSSDVATGQDSDEKIRALVETITTQESEYKVIPQIWEIALANGKANDAGQIKKLLELAVPRPEAKLRDWQAVVLGGSIINGLSQSGVWPRSRLAELMDDDKEMQLRWKRTVELAAKMADDEGVPSGTRYDALRILGADRFEGGKQQFAKYIAKGAHGELQMGAVSALGDINEPAATELLLLNVPELTDPNRELAIAALIRTDERACALVDRINGGKLPPNLLTAKQLQQLTESKNAELREKVGRLIDSRK